jgi:hypothetical protein
MSSTRKQCYFYTGKVLVAPYREFSDAFDPDDGTAPAAIRDQVLSSDHEVPENCLRVYGPGRSSGNIKGKVESLRRITNLAPTLGVATPFDIKYLPSRAKWKQAIKLECRRSFSRLGKPVDAPKHHSRCELSLQFKHSPRWEMLGPLQLEPIVWDRL